MKFVVAVAPMSVAFFSFTALASVPSAAPAVVNANGTIVNGAFIAATCHGGDWL